MQFNLYLFLNIEFRKGHVKVSSCLPINTCYSYQLISSQYFWLSIAQPIRIWLSSIQTSFGIFNLLEDNSIESISLHWLQSNQSYKVRLAVIRVGFQCGYYVWEHDVLNQIYLPDKHVFSHSECSSSLQSFIIIGVLIDYDMWEQRHETA